MRIRSMMIILTVLVPMVAARAGDEPTDLGKIQGRWEASIGKKREFAVTLDVSGNDVSAVIVPKRGPKLKATGGLQLDESVSPRALDWVKFSTADGIEVPKLLSIYRLEGDHLIVRSGGFNDARPKTFEAGGEGLWTEIMVFSRPAVAKGASITAHP